MGTDSIEVRTVASDGCLSHLLVCGREAAIVDPARDTGKYHALVAGRGARLRWVIDTHTHADHLSGAAKLAGEAEAKLVMAAPHGEQWRAAAGQADSLGIGDILRANGGVAVDVAVADGDRLELGAAELGFVHAPGHTLDSLVIRAGARLFTGDTLLVGQIGRCDLPGGDPAAMYDTLFERLAAEPDETFIYPGHDYQGQTLTVLGLERARNPFLVRRSRAEFEAYLATAFPSLTGAGMQCGAASVACDAAAGPRPVDPLRDEVAGFMDDRFFGRHDGDHEIAPVELQRLLAEGRPICVLDVREPGEFATGRVPGARNLSVHEIDRRLDEIPVARDHPVVTICKAGRRSGWAAMFLRVAGFRDVRSVPGGMTAWRESGLPVDE